MRPKPAARCATCHACAVEFADVVRRRKMVRNFTTEPVDRAVIDRIMSTAVRAPSAGFTQGWGFLVLDSPEHTTRFWDTTFTSENRETFRYGGMFNAPVIIVPCSNENAYLDRYAEPDKGWTDRDPGRWPVPFWHIDAGFASMQILNAVVDEGLGALFFGVFGEHVPAVHAAFGIPDDFTPIGAIAIGHPAPTDEKSPSLRRGWKPRDEVIHFNAWGRR